MRIALKLCTLAITDYHSWKDIMNFYFFFLLITLTNSLFSMEPVNERAPLLPTRIAMNESQEIKNAPNILCAGYRRYFDKTSKRKVECNECTERTWRANVASISIAPMGSLFAGQVPLYIWTCCNKTSGCLLAGCCGMAAEWMVPGCLVVYGISMCLANCEPNDEFTEFSPNDPRDELLWKGKLHVPQELLKIACECKTIALTTTEYKNFKYNLTHPPTLSHEQQEIENRKDKSFDTCFPTLTDCIRCFTRFSSTRSRILETFLNMNNQAPLIQFQLASHFFRTRKVPKPIIQRILRYIDFVRQYFLSENELIHLLDGLSNEQDQYYNYPSVCSSYAHQILLAHNGWCSFTQSGAYPIPARIKYFDATRLDAAVAQWYVALDGPRIYLPYSAKLAACYRFEDDPVYQDKNLRESNDQIKRLLELRKKFVNPHHRLQPDNSFSINN